MSKVLSVNNGNYTVKVEGGGQILFDTSRGTLVSGKPAGTVVIRGSLEVEGTTTTVESNDTLINDNILTLNNGQTGAGISASKNYQAGIEIDRGSEATAKFVFDDSVAWDIGGDSGTGGFKLFTGSGAKTTLVLDGIKSNAALYIDTGNNGISVTNATDYETNVFPYTGSAVTGGAIDDDMIPNAKAVVDYVAFANASLLQNRIEEGTTTKTFVQSRDDNYKKVSSYFNENFDIILIDSLHEPSHVSKLIYTYWKHLKLNGSMYIDDISWLPYMKNSWRDHEYTENINRDTFNKILEIQLSNYDNLNLTFSFSGSGMCRIIKQNNKVLNKPKLMKPRENYIKKNLKKLISLFKKT